MKSKPIVWTIAGSDSGGGAGIQADLKSIHTLGAHGCSIITALTSQNSKSVQHIELTSEHSLSQQIQALKNDLPANAIKLGMLGNINSLKIIASFLKNYSGFIVVDPVFSTSTDCVLADQDLIEAYIHTLAPIINLITPNIPETENLLGCKIYSNNDVELAAKRLIELGFKNVLIKGGHGDEFNSLWAQDYWTNGIESFWLSQNRINCIHTHGSGCTLSSAIASCIALGYELKDAIVIAKMYVTQGIRNGKQIGEGAGSIAHLNWPEQPSDLPYLTSTYDFKQFQFKECERIGLYPIVDRASWLEKLLPLGINTIQLRIKDLTGIELENEIQSAIKIANQFNAQLFINDYWQLAIKHNAFGVHLGQEDIETADFNSIQAHQLALGISTHCYYELATAHALNPSYVALGPIYETTSKVMRFQPQGLDNLRRWRKIFCGQLVAIGGINKNNIDDVIQCQPDGIAMISAITKAADHGSLFEIHDRYSNQQTSERV